MIHLKHLHTIVWVLINVKAEPTSALRFAALKDYLESIEDPEELETTNLLLSFQIGGVFPKFKPRYNVLHSDIDIVGSIVQWSENPTRIEFYNLPHQLQLFIHFMASPSSIGLGIKRIIELIPTYIDPYKWLADHRDKIVIPTNQCHFCGIPKARKTDHLCPNCYKGLKSKVAYHNQDFAFTITQEGFTWGTLPTKDFGDITIRHQAYQISRIGLHDFICILITNEDLRIQLPLEFSEYQAIL